MKSIKKAVKSKALTKNEKERTITIKPASSKEDQKINVEYVVRLRIPSAVDSILKSVIAIQGDASLEAFVKMAVLSRLEADVDGVFQGALRDQYNKVLEEEIKS